MKKILLLLLSVLAFVSCSKNDSNSEKFDPKTQGRAIFELVRHNVYIISDLTEARTIKVTLLTEKGDTLTLPSLPLLQNEMNEDLIQTAPYPLAVGEYRLLSYRCFDLQGDLIEDLDVAIKEEDQEPFAIIAGEDEYVALPTEVKVVISTSNLYNTLQGICLEILGPDEETWPKSWDFASGEISIEWAGLEFDTDAMSNPTDVIGIVIDGEPDYIINSDTWEEQLVSLPEFKHMTVLPACISNLTRLENIVVRNCDLEEVPAELQYSRLTSFAVENTNLASLPDEFGNMTNLTDFAIKNNKFTEFPECISNISTMEVCVIENEAIPSFPASIANWEKLTSLTIAGTEIASLPDVFDKLWHVSSLDLHNNKHLASLPATLALEKIPYGTTGSYSLSGITGIDLSHCAFTELPQQLQRSGLRYLNLAHNSITSLSKEALEKMSDLETLILDGNKLTSFPKLTNSKLQMLSLIGTGLTREQVDLSGMPNLNPRYVFFTQEEYDAVFK